MNVNVVNFQIQKLISQRFRAQKVDEKIISFMVINLPKKVYFLQICAKLSKKPKHILRIFAGQKFLRR